MPLLPINPSPCVPGVGEGGMGEPWKGGEGIGFGLDGPKQPEGNAYDYGPQIQALLQALRELSQRTGTNFQYLAKGFGSVKRFRLREAMSLGTSATIDLIANDGSGTTVGGGIVYDVEPGGLWEGDADDEGWCTAIDGAENQYAIIFMQSANETGGSAGSVAGGYHAGVTQVLAVGNQNAQWTSFNSASDSAFSEDPDATKESLIFNETGLYVVMCSVSFSNSHPTAAGLCTIQGLNACAIGTVTGAVPANNSNCLSSQGLVNITSAPSEGQIRIVYSGATAETFVTASANSNLYAFRVHG